jgi:hypothetical protein
MQYKLWNRKDKINGVEASHFLNQPTFKNYTGDIILIYADNGRVTQIESKEVLAKVYGINVNLSLNAFMAQYFAILEEQNKEPIEEAQAE